MVAITRRLLIRAGAALAAGIALPAKPKITAPLTGTYSGTYSNTY